jgi:transcriptional regulator with XRE-family HTH domain
VDEHEKRRRAMADAVNARMTKLGLGQKELARKARVSDPTIRILQDGTIHDFRPATLQKVSLALGLDAQHLAALQDGKDPPPVPEPTADPSLLEEVLRRQDATDRRIERLALATGDVANEIAQLKGLVLELVQDRAAG